MPKFGNTWPPSPAFFVPRGRMAWEDDGVYTGASTVGTPVTNLIIYYPKIVETALSVTALEWTNGTTASLNVILGLYTADGTKVGTDTGSVAQSGASVVQSAAPTGGTFVIGPGLYYIGMIFSGNTANTARGVVLANADLGRTIGILQEAAGSFALPATATFATLTNTPINYCGIVGNAIQKSGQLVSPATLTPFHLLSIASTITSVGGLSLTSCASAVWPAANRALYFPITRPSTIIVKQAFIMAGATWDGATPHHFDLGIYDGAGNKIVSTGATNMNGTINALQTVDITDTEIGPGLYYLAAAIDTGTDTTFRSNPSLGSLGLAGVQQQASAYPLPATATFAVVAATYVPVFGFTTQAVI